MRCPACDVENPDEARFCMACAATLVSSAAQVRKTVTILFSDVSGSTALGESLDPETLRGVMGSYFDVCRDVLARHGGTVEKFIGDAVMAVFGVPVAHEDDALRAVRAADEIRVALAALNERFDRDHGVRVQVRTGINTGEVMAGDPGAGQAFVSGDAVNVAARLEQAAPPGEVLLSGMTRGLLGDGVAVEPIDPLELKGKSEPVPAFRLVSVAETSQPIARRSDTGFVGRRDELDLLVAAFERVLSEQRCHLVTVVGEPGVGKSRLIGEFVHRVGDRAMVVLGRCLSYGEGVTFYPAAEILAQVVGSTDADDAAGIAGRIRSVVGEGEEGELIVQRLLRMLGLGDAGSGAPEEIFWAVRRLLEIGAAKRPMVAILDDIQWGEPPLLDLIEHICDLSRAAPLLLVCMARPDLLADRAGWGTGRTNASMVVLEPLSSGECEDLLIQLVGDDRIMAEPLRRVLEAAEGNPLFLEQMAAHLVDERLIVRTADGWTWSAAGGAPVIPASLQALLSARLDRVSEAERIALQCGSVEGQVFHRGSVSSMTAPERTSEIVASLGPLIGREFLEPEAAEFVGEDAFRFRHLLIRDAAYESMTKELRADLHERFALWLVQRARDRLPEYEEIVGFHLEEAHRYLTELGGHEDSVPRLGSAASKHLAGAGRSALRRGDLRAAAKLLLRSADLSLDDEERAWLLVEALPALNQIGESKAVVDAANDLERIVAGSGSARLEMRAFLVRQELFALSFEGPSEQYRPKLDEAIRVLSAEGDHDGLAQAHNLVAFDEWMMLQTASARASWTVSAEHARQAGSRTMESEALAWVAISHFFGETPVPQALVVAEEIRSRLEGVPLGEAKLLDTLSSLQAMKGDQEAASRLEDESLRLLDEYGFVEWAVHYRSQSLAFNRWCRGDSAGRIEALRFGFERSKAIGQQNEFLATELALALAEDGKTDEAGSFLALVESAGLDEDNAHIRFSLLEASALIAALRGRDGEALRHVRALRVLLAASDFLVNRAEAVLVEAKVALILGDRVGSGEAVQEAIRMLERKEAPALLQLALDLQRSAAGGP
jgi:class 3 adenylate cyclase